MPKGVVLSGQSRELVIRLRDYFERENQNGGPLLRVSQVRERVAEALGISLHTVTKITKEVYGKNGDEYNKPITPKKKKMPFRVTSMNKIDTDAIRRHIYDYYYLKKESPTLKKLVISLRDCDLFRGQKSSLATVLKRIGFSFRQVDKKKMLMERSDITLARCNFLKEAKQIENWENVIFMDETWVYANHSLSEVQICNSTASTSKEPMENGERIIICHAGSKKGFVEEALLVFQSEITGDYHEEINSDIFEGWFQDLVLSLKEPTYFIMDNAPYHSRLLNQIPTSSNEKSEIITWLRDNGENVDECTLMCELVNKLKTTKKPKPRYAVDELAAQHGHKVLRLPVNHHQYNAIELIWAQVKKSIARLNTSPPFTANKMLVLLKNACNQVTSENWSSVVDKTMNIILSDWERDVALDNIREQGQVIINTNEDSSSCESSMSED